MKNSLLSLNDISTERFFIILNGIQQFKKDIISRKVQKTLENKVIGLLFNQPSTRTRTSFESAMVRMGGNSIYLSELRLKRDSLVHSTIESDFRYAEPIKDTARMLNAYLDGLIVRTRDHKMIEELAMHSDIPVINANSDREHPTQIINDIFTIQEIAGSLSGLNLTYLGDGNNTCCSLLLGCAHAGINMIAACPNEAQPNSDTVQAAKKIGKKTGAKISLMESPEDAVKEADILYTDAWISMSDPIGKEKLFQRFGKYQINSRLHSQAKKNALVMHCLPAHRGIEITDDVLEGPCSIAWKQGENKIYTAASVLSEFIV